MEKGKVKIFTTIATRRGSEIMSSATDNEVVKFDKSGMAEVPAEWALKLMEIDESISVVEGSVEEVIKAQETDDINTLKLQNKVLIEENQNLKAANDTLHAKVEMLQAEIEKIKKNSITGETGPLNISADNGKVTVSALDEKINALPPEKKELALKAKEAGTEALKAELAKQTVPQLKSLLESRPELKKEEWQSLAKDDLIKYIVSH